VQPCALVNRPSNLSEGPLIPLVWRGLAIIWEKIVLPSGGAHSFS